MILLAIQRNGTVVELSFLRFKFVSSLTSQFALNPFCNVTIKNSQIIYERAKELLERGRCTQETLVDSSSLSYVYILPGDLFCYYNKISHLNSLFEKKYRDLFLPGLGAGKFKFEANSLPEGASSFLSKCGFQHHVLFRQRRIERKEVSYIPRHLYLLEGGFLVAQSFLKDSTS